MMKTLDLAPSKIVIKQGDITLEEVDIIVTAANSRLAGGGGVDGAIHRAAGFELNEACRAIRQKIGLCEPGFAVITKAGKLKAKYVIHAVGPVWQGGMSQERDTLISAYRSALQLAVENGAKIISFPSISTGSFGYPIDHAAPAAIAAIKAFLKDSPPLEVRLILFTEDDYKTYEKYLK